MNNITFEELYEYIKENCDENYNLFSYLDGFIDNMIDNFIYNAIFALSENEMFEIEVNRNLNRIETYNVKKLENISSYKKEKPFFKFELNGLDVFHLSAILYAVAYKQGRGSEEFVSDADRLMRKLFDQTHKEK